MTSPFFVVDLKSPEDEESRLTGPFLAKHQINQYNHKRFVR